MNNPGNKPAAKSQAGARKEDPNRGKLRHPFVFGEIFENGNGAYKVVNVDEKANRLVVEYVESGKLAELTLSYQANIYDRHCREQARAQRQAELEAAPPPKRKTKS